MYNATRFIDTVIRGCKKPIAKIIADLEEKIVEWEFEKYHLSLVNLFDMSDEDYNKMNYLNALIEYGSRLVRRFKREKEMFDEHTAKFKTDMYKVLIHPVYRGTSHFNKPHKPKSV